MADENDAASDYEQGERDRILSNHARRLASIRPAEDCRECDEPLAEHRKAWGRCIDCATRAEARAKGYRR